MISNASNNALSGMLAIQQEIALVSQNVANANTPGYTEKQQSTVATADGVTVGAVTREVDAALSAAVMNAGASASSLQAQSNALQTINQELGTPGSGNSLSDAITGLQTAYQELSSDPGDPASQQAVVDAAQTVAQQLNSLYGDAQQTTSQATSSIQSQAASANSYISDIVQLNQEIAAGSSAGSDVTDLEDQRDQDVQQLGQIVGITTYTGADGSLNVYTTGGQALVNGPSAYSITVQPSGSVVITSPDGSTTPLSTSTGTIGGLLTVVQTTMPQFEAQLDDIANALTLGVQSAGVPLFNDGGSTTYDPTANPGQEAGYADRIAVNSAVVANPELTQNTADSADTTNIDAVLAFFNSNTTSFSSQGLPSQASIVQAATDFTTNFSTLASNLQSEQTQETSTQQALQQRLSSETGVNVDQELSNLVQLQENYSANGQMFQALNEMTNTLFASLGDTEPAVM